MRGVGERARAEAGARCGVGQGGREGWRERRAYGGPLLLLLRGGVFALDGLCAREDLGAQLGGVGGGEGGADAHACALDGEGGVGLEELDALGDLAASASSKRERTGRGESYAT